MENDSTLNPQPKTLNPTGVLVCGFRGCGYLGDLEGGASA